MNQIYSSLGQLLSSALPAFHALFGCDYTAAFSRKGKVCPFKCLENSKEAQCAFSNLAVDLPSIKEEVSDIEKLCVHYMGKENWIPFMMRDFKFFAISTIRKMKISRNKSQKFRWKSYATLQKRFN